MGNELKGTLYHKTIKDTQCNWIVQKDHYGYTVHLRIYPSGETPTIKVYHGDYPTLTPEVIRNEVLKWAKENSYTQDKPEYPMPVLWRIEQHLDTKVVVVYTINDVELKATVTIPGADAKITEDLVRIAIDNEIKAAVRKRRFTGMSGVVYVAPKEEDKHGDSPKD